MPTISSFTLAMLSMLILVSGGVLLFPEAAFALNIEKIGQGVVGDNRRKMAVLKDIVFYSGIFFTVLGALVIIFRKRKFTLQKRNDTSNAAGPFLMVIGCLMMTVFFFK